MAKRSRVHEGTETRINDRIRVPGEPSVLLVNRASRLIIACVISVFAGSTAEASGFSLLQQGARASGLAGAYAGLADDPSAVFYNVGGLAWVEQNASFGASGLADSSGSFQGMASGVASDIAGEQESSSEARVHAFYVKALGEALKLGVGIYQPFGFNNEWRDADFFSGRGISTNSELETFDLNVSLGYELHPKVAVGAGVVQRFAEIKHSRRVQGIDPIGRSVVDFGSFGIETDRDSGIGWTLGFLAKPSEAFSIGVSHRSAVDIDFTGSGRLTQLPSGNSQLDDLVGASLPFDEDLGVISQLEFPATTTVGLALRYGALVWVIDVAQTDWSSVQVLSFNLPSQSSLDRDIKLLFDDADRRAVGRRIGHTGWFRGAPWPGVGGEPSAR